MRRDLLDVILVISRLIRANGVALSVKRVDLAVRFIVESPLWKVLIRAVFYVYLEERLRNNFFLVVVDEVCVYFLAAPEKVEVNVVVGEEAARGKWCVIATDR